MATGAKKLSKQRYNVFTSRQCCVITFTFLHDMKHAICMFPPNMKQIDKNMQPQWPKQIFATSRRHDVVTSRKFQTPYYTRPGHIYDVSKFEEDRLRNKKVHSLINMVVGGGWWWWSSSNDHSLIVHLAAGDPIPISFSRWRRLVLRSDALARALIVPWLRLVLAIGVFKGRTSRARW